MTERYLTNEQADEWQDIACKLKQASDLVSQCEVQLLVKLDITGGKPLDRVQAAGDALSGLAYLFTPQPEWTGGDSSDPKNTKIRRPHICSD